MPIFLETNRLMLRRFTEADDDNLVGLDNYLEVTRFLNGGKPDPREEIHGQIRRLLGCYERFEDFGFWRRGRRPPNGFWAGSNSGRMDEPCDG